VTLGTDEIAFQFVSEGDLVSGVIRWFSHAAVSHVDLVLPDGRLFGAHLWGGVKARPPDYARWSTVRRIAIRTPAAPAVYAAALSQDGKPYDWRAIAGFALDRDWRARDSWICSELHAWALEQGRFFAHPLVLNAAKLTPGDLLLVLSPFGDVERIVP
jgi:hypothetical protein